MHSESLLTATKPAWLAQALEGALAKITALHATAPGIFLHLTNEGHYQPCEPCWWTAGFWPGMLWQAYRFTRRAEFAHTAQPADEIIANCFLDERFYRLHHDVGFQFLHTAVPHYILTGEEVARQRALLAASFLMGRFNLKGRFIRAWNVPGSENLSIIDSMMNLPLLLWASRQTGDERFAQVALAHADTVLERVMRSNGTLPHIVKIEPGQPVVPWAEGSQGYSLDSVWARGQAWAMYGFAQLYRFTNQPRYLTASQKIANAYLRRLPADFLPLWDFDAPSGQSRDTSAAACAASGLLELANLCGVEIYRQTGLATLENLHTQCATWNLPDEQGLLREATEHFPKGRGINTSLIYGDYYFLEALLKLEGLPLLYL